MFWFGNKNRKALDHLRVNHPEEVGFSDEDLQKLPNVFRNLLTAQGSTLEALEKYVRCPLKATVSQGEKASGILSRAVYLETGDGEIVSLGLSTVNPRMLPEDARTALLEGKMPLGRLLEEYKVEHDRIIVEASTIRKYNDNWASAHLLGDGPHYGRTYTIFHSKGPIFIADVKEIFSNGLYFIV